MCKITTIEAEDFIPEVIETLRRMCEASISGYRLQLQYLFIKQDDVKAEIRERSIELVKAEKRMSKLKRTTGAGEEWQELLKETQK